MLHPALAIPFSLNQSPPLLALWRSTNYSKDSLVYNYQQEGQEKLVARLTKKNASYVVAVSDGGFVSLSLFPCLSSRLKIS